jgi:hypothetical protein
LWRPVILDLRYDLVLAGREVKVRQVLLELSQVEITQVAQIAKAHVLVPPISLSINVKSVFTHIALSAKPTPTVRETLARLPDLEPECLISVSFAYISGNRKTGNSIAPKNIEQGTGGKPLCEECERLNSLGVQ